MCHDIPPTAEHAVMTFSSSSHLDMDRPPVVPRVSRRHSVLALLLVGLTACATLPEEPRGRAPRTYALDVQPKGSEAPRPQSTKKDSLGPIQSSAMDVDYFQGLLVRAGVPPHALPRNGHRITPDEAMELLSWLLAAEVRLRDFGPWRMAAHLLWEVVHGEATVSRKELYERMRRFSGLLVLRPDGNLVRATTGEAVQFIDTVRLDDGALRAEGFEVGPFYTPRQGRFLYVSANGTLALRRLVLPTEAMATAVSTGSGTLYILHMSAQGAGGGGGEPGGKSWRPPPGGPGKWVRKNEGMKPGARQYQCQVTGAPEGWVYRVERNGERFDFDGYKDGCLLDAKGPGYDNKFLNNLEPEPWFKETGAQELLDNAARQLRVADGVPIRWHVAEAHAAKAIRRLLREGGHPIEIIHTPVLKRRPHD
jgi:hypothetical protein